MRLFAGIELDDATRAACGAVIEQLRRAGFAAKFEELEKLHVTLAFLGNVDAGRHAEIARVMDEVATVTAPLQIPLDRVGAFPHERKPRVVYVGAREQGRAFRTLCTRLRDGYSPLGFEFKDDAVAHVTIARVKASQRPLPLIDVAPATLSVRALTLFESVHDPEKNTSRYVTSATSDLRGS